ncbi:hypothetical protein [Flavobacterium sp. N2013]|uniref:hypothetical protein n=1 Tax=Flavobacterium sp. N2013 TaxID=2986828 RepID=UPI0022256850|nr:hypothetical protein [Flavobacterium sp. N2013]
MKLLIKVVKNYSGVIFFGSLYVLNLLTSFSPDNNQSLIILTIVCLIYPTIQKHHPWN